MLGSMSFAIKVPKDFLFATFVGLSNIYVTWVPYIISGDQSNSDLRRAAISIWLNSLMEFLEKKPERDAAVAALNQIGICPQIITQRISELEADAVQILSCFSMNEQIILWYIRNQAVHGHLSLYFRDDVGISIFDAATGLVVRQSLSRLDIQAAMQSLAGFEPMQRLYPFKESNALLNATNKVLSSTAIDEYHMALFGRHFDE